LSSAATPLNSSPSNVEEDFYVTTLNLSALRHAATPKLRDKIINKINRKLPAGQKLRVNRKQFSDHRFYITRDESNAVRLFTDELELLRFALEIGVTLPS
jgi:hypothetical protein